MDFLVSIFGDHWLLYVGSGAGILFMLLALVESTRKHHRQQMEEYEKQQNQSSKQSKQSK